jgi:hypothetical protein
MVKVPTYLENLRKITRKEVDTVEEQDALVRELYGQNDRATVLLFSALVDRSLESFPLFRLKLRWLTPCPLSDRSRGMTSI